VILWSLVDTNTPGETVSFIFTVAVGTVSF
jgi:hypothetical protein